jgi:hypothetical protein
VEECWQTANEGKYSFVAVWTYTDLAVVVVVVTALSPPSLYIIRTFVMSKGSRQLSLFCMFVASADRWTCRYGQFALDGDKDERMRAIIGRK